MRTETHTRRPALSILKGLVIFLHEYTHSGRFSIGSPRSSVLNPVNGWFFSTGRGLGELASITPSNCAEVSTDNDAVRTVSALFPTKEGAEQRGEVGSPCPSISGNKSSLGKLAKSLLFPSKSRTYGMPGVNAF